jgi:flagellar export protein FliJ
MKRFRFTLQAILTLRQREEHQALERYAAALLSRRQAAEKLALLEDEMSHAAAALRVRLSEGSVAVELAHLQSHYETLERRHDQAREALAAAERLIRPAHEEMLEARRQREVVEGCQEKQRQRHDRELLRDEAKVHDELALRRFAPALVWRGND